MHDRLAGVDVHEPDVPYLVCQHRLPHAWAERLEPGGIDEEVEIARDAGGGDVFPPGLLQAAIQRGQECAGTIHTRRCDEQAEYGPVEHFLQVHGDFSDGCIDILPALKGGACRVSGYRPLTSAQRHTASASSLIRAGIRVFKCCNDENGIRHMKFVGVIPHVLDDNAGRLTKGYLVWGTEKSAALIFDSV